MELVFKAEGPDKANHRDWLFSDVIFTPDGHGVAAVMMTTVAIWDTSNGALKDYFDRSSGSSSDCLAVSPDGHWLAVMDGQFPHMIDIIPPLAP